MYFFLTISFSECILDGECILGFFQSGLQMAAHDRRDGATLMVFGPYRQARKPSEAFLKRYSNFLGTFKTELNTDVHTHTHTNVFVSGVFKNIHV